MNGYKFHTKSYGETKRTSNHGVCIKGSVYADVEEDFYGTLVEIIEVSYSGQGNQVVLFKCEWYDTTRGMRTITPHGLVEINHKSRLASSDHFILASQAQQVYYMSYPSQRRDRRDWWIVCKTIPRRTYNLEVTNSNDDQQDDEDNIYQDYDLHEDRSSPLLVLDVVSHTLTNVGAAEEVDESELLPASQTVIEDHSDEEFE